MGILKEFREFALKGNLVDMSVAFVMGAAFNKLVSSFIEGIIMPPVGLLTTGKDFSTLTFTIKQKTEEIKDASGIITQKAADAVVIKYGAFITVALDFVIVAFAMFMVIKGINIMKKRVEAKQAEAAAAAPPAPSTEEKLLTEIRDILKQR